MELSERESKILKALIELFIESAKPVGSKTLTEKLDIGLSPASVRNTLASLEEKGFLEKPHTSAGRVPTVEGYRYYVSRLMQPAKLDPEEKAEIERSIALFRSDTYELLESVTRALSKLSKQLGIIVAPFGEDLVLFRVDCIPISKRMIFLVVSTTDGLVRSVPLEFSREIDFRRLYAILALINERLGGLALGEIRSGIEHRFADVVNIHEDFLLRFVNSAEEIFRFDLDKALHYCGTGQLIEKPEFQRSSRLKALVSLLEDKSALTRLLTVSPASGSIRVRVGWLVEDVSVAMCEYDTRKSRGTIGIVGPLRMDYSKAVSIISFTSSRLSATLKK